MKMNVVYNIQLNSCVPLLSFATFDALSYPRLVLLQPICFTGLGSWKRHWCN